MKIYILKKVLNIIPILIGVSLIIFFIFNVIGIDPTVVILGKNATKEQINSLREQLGLNKSFLFQYLDTVKSFFSFDFGRSWVSNKKISDILFTAIPVSLSFAFPALLLSNFISIILSFISVYFNKKYIDQGIFIVCVIMMSISGIANIILVQWIFGYKLDLLPIEGYEHGFPYFIPYIILPCIVWLITNLGQDTLLYRTLILNELGKSYVRTALVTGESKINIFYRYVLKNIMISVFTNMIIQIPYLLLGGILMENFFGIPGLGSVIMHSIEYNDFPIIKSMTVIAALFYVILNIVADIIYSMIDPRIVRS